MRNDRIIPGTILVFIGGLFLLNNFGYIDFSWGALFNLWPLFLIIGGVNLVFAHNRTGWATGLKVFVLLAGMGIIIYAGTGHRYSHNWNWGNRQDYTFDDEDSTDNSNQPDSIKKIEGTSQFNASYHTDIKTAILNISGGATKYTIDDTTNQLFDASTREHGAGYYLKTNLDGVTETLDFTMNSRHHGFIFNWGGHRSNQAVIRLNPNPDWEINVETGATKIDFDLSKFKVTKLKLSGGVASFDVKLGQPVGDSHVDVSTGVSNVRIHIPQNAACEVITDTGLSDKHFEGMDKISDNHYQSPGFANAANKFYVNINGGVSNFRVQRY